MHWNFGSCVCASSRLGFPQVERKNCLFTSENQTFRFPSYYVKCLLMFYSVHRVICVFNDFIAVCWCPCLLVALRGPETCIWPPNFRKAPWIVWHSYLSLTWWTNAESNGIEQQYTSLYWQIYLRRLLEWKSFNSCSYLGSDLSRFTELQPVCRWTPKENCPRMGD